MKSLNSYISESKDNDFQDGYEDGYNDCVKHTTQFLKENGQDALVKKYKAYIESEDIMTAFGD